MAAQVEILALINQVSRRIHEGNVMALFMAFGCRELRAPVILPHWIGSL
jgi:hypothetical protein